MKICEYHPRISYYIGGGEITVIDQIKRLSKSNDIIIVTSKTDKPTEQFSELIKEQSMGVRYVENPFIKSEEFSLGERINHWDLESITFGENAQEIILEEEFDLVVTHYSVDNILLPSKINNALHLHGVPPRKKRLDELSLMNTNHFVSVSNFVTEGWNEWYNLGKIPTCYNGIDCNKFVDLNNPRDIDVLYLGRMVPYKRLDILVKALQGLEGLKIVFGGQGSEKSKLQDLAKEKGVNIEFRGYVSDKEIVNLYNRSKTFVHTADTREGVITTGLEAMACGVIPILSGSCGMLEAVENGVNGFLFEPLNSKELHMLIKKIYNNYDKLKRIKTRAKRKVREIFDCNKTINQLEEIYRSYVYGR